MNARIAAAAACLSLILAAVAPAATLDPLLKGLLAKSAGEDAASVFYERLVAMETDAKGEVRVGVILHLDGRLPDLSDVPGLRIGCTLGGLATARLPLSSLGALAAHEDLRHVEASTLSYPTMDMAVPAAGVDDVWAGTPAYTGEGVIVGVIDTGIDFTHEDFDDASGNTRILNIWDLFGTGTPPTGFDDGAEWSSSQIDAGTATQRDNQGHGSHVSGIAAGDGSASAGHYSGVAPDADIIFVKAYSDDAGAFASDDVINAMSYLAAKQQDYDRPMVVNMSLGGHSDAHDGTSARELAIDTLSEQGIVFCISAGNEGESDVCDHGSASDADLVYRLESYTPNSGTQNDYALVFAWVDGSTSPTVTVSFGSVSTTAVTSGDALAFSTAVGRIVIDNASDGVNALNGDKLIMVELDDYAGTPPEAGDWTIHIEGGSGEVHAWDVLSTMGTGFPNSDQSYSVGVPGTAASAITVGALKSRQQWPSLAGTVGYSTSGTWGAAEIGDRAPFSSIGPTRDGREKPDVVAPGMAIVSVRSGDTTPNDNVLVSGGDYFVTQGTSMSCPFTTGVVALMLEKNGDLTPAEIKSILRSTAATDAYTGTTWNAEWGAGKLDAAAALAAVTGEVTPDGDIDFDGTASVVDVILLVNYIVDPTGHPLGSDARQAADVAPAPDGDGVLDASDLVRLVAFILGTDAPGKTATGSVLATVGAAREEADGWWMPVTFSGEGLAAGQFALDLDGADWRDAAPRIDADGSVSSAVHVAGDRLRMMLYDLDNALPATLTVDLPCDGPGEPRPAGLLTVDASGAALASAWSLPAAAGYVHVWPNPVAAGAEIRFAPPRAGDYVLAVYDLRGRRVRALSAGDAASAPGVLDWRGEDDAGRPLPDGIYMLRLESGGRAVTTKVLIAR